MKYAGLMRSMSKKGGSPDNAACEGFFGQLKNEGLSGHSWTQRSPDNVSREPVYPLVEWQPSQAIFRWEQSLRV